MGSPTTNERIINADADTAAAAPAAAAGLSSLT